MPAFLWLLFAPCLNGFLGAAPIERVWLTHASPTPSRIVVNWETDDPSDSAVEFGTSGVMDQVRKNSDLVRLHHIEIPLDRPEMPCHYRVRSGKEASAPASFKGYPVEELRLVIVGDWGFAMHQDVAAIARDDPHLLLTVGDNVPDLHGKGRQGTRAFSQLIDANRQLFRSTPFMPVLGNHDREIAPRGPAPPSRPVYDIEASAYREFFALPGDEWKWWFEIPGFDLRIIALDLSHIDDFGTTWQTCHAWQPGSPQFQWFAETIAAGSGGFVLTLVNEKQTRLQHLAQGAWHEHFRRGSALISGFGYFADRALLAGGLPYYNTCLIGNGDLYKDPQSQFHAREDNYLLITLRAGAPAMRVQFKNLEGKVLDTTEIARRK